MDSQIFDVISELVAGQARVEKARVRPESRLIDFGIDSVGVIELIIDLERSFLLEIPDQDLKDVESLQNVADYVQMRLEAL